ncbi:DUF7504 family protein [Haladaptatus sp. NG-SE-30]
MNDCRELLRDTGDVSAFQSHLGTLRQRGSNLLVTGEVSQGVANRASQTLFGDEAHDRKRVLALTDAGVDTADDHFQSGVGCDDDSVWLIDRGNRRRAVPQSATGADTELPPLDGQNGIRELREEIVTAIGFYDDAAGGVEPAAIRLGINSLNYLVDEHELVAVKRFLRSVGALMKGVHGMGHYHLSMPDDAETV